MWNTILNALGWLLMQIYLLIPNFAAAIVIFSLVTKVILIPFGMKSKKGMLRMQKLQPKTKAIEAKYKDDKNRAQLEIQKVYKEEKISPLSGCLWTLIPFPILIALFYVVRLPLSHMMGIGPDEITLLSNLPIIVDYVSANGVSLADLAQNQLPLMNAIHENFAAVLAAMPELSGRLIDISFQLFNINLSYIPTLVINVYWILPVLSALSAWLNTVVLQRMQGPMVNQPQGSMKLMTYMGPVMSLVFGFSLPSVMSLYWTANSLFAMAQDVLLTLYYRKKLGIASPAELKEQEQKEREELERLEIARKERLARLAEEGPAAKRNNMSNKKYRQLKAQQGAKQQKLAAVNDTKVDETEDDYDQVDADGVDLDNETAEERTEGND